MKAISTLLKLAQKNLDKLLLTKKSLNARLEEIQYSLSILQKEMKNEINNYFNSEYRFFLDQYLKGANLKIDNFQKSIIDLEKQIEHINKDIMEHFAEIKRYEIIAENHRKEKIQAEHKQEITNLDELTILKYKND